MNVLFYILRHNFPSPLCSEVKAKASNCLAEFVYTRLSLFDNVEARYAFE